MYIQPLSTAVPPVLRRDEAGMPTWLGLLLATACGLIAANIYYAQPLVGPISAALHLSPGAAGLIATMAQVGYGAGLLLVVPLCDLFENRRLVFLILCVAVLALLSAAVSTGAAAFLAAATLIGLGSVAVQILVPYAAHLAPDASRGRVVGNVMSGLMLGIMLARPAASLVTEALSWRAVFVISSALMASLAVVLWVALPRRQPAPGLSYGGLLASMARFVRHTPILRRRAIYQACLFGAFSLFWTAVPLQLASRYHLSQNGIALFALVGVTGAVAAPLAGRMADRGWSKPVTAFAMSSVGTALLLGLVGSSASGPGLLILAAAAILLDFGVAANGVLGQRAIYALDAAARGRLNGLYMATFFGGGAIGSALGGWSYAEGGWPLTMAAGLLLPALALAYFLTEKPELQP